MRINNLHLCAVLIAVVFLSCSLDRASAEVISWKPKGEVTVEACMHESHQSRPVCEAIVKLWKESERYGTLEIGRVMEED